MWFYLIIISDATNGVLPADNTDLTDVCLLIA